MRSYLALCVINAYGNLHLSTQPTTSHKSDTRQDLLLGPSSSIGNVDRCCLDYLVPARCTPTNRPGGDMEIWFSHGCSWYRLMISSSVYVYEHNLNIICYKVTFFIRYLHGHNTEGIQGNLQKLSAENILGRRIFVYFADLACQYDNLHQDQKSKAQCPRIFL